MISVCACVYQTEVNRPEYLQSVRGIYVLAHMPNLAFGINWGLTADLMTDCVISPLEKWVLEDLRSSIEVQHVLAPNDFELQFNSRLGNAFGIEPRIA